MKRLLCVLGLAAVLVGTFMLAKKLYEKWQVFSGEAKEGVETTKKRLEWQLGPAKKAAEEDIARKLEKPLAE